MGFKWDQKSLLAIEARHLHYQERNIEDKIDFSKEKWYKVSKASPLSSHILISFKKKVVPKLIAFMMSPNVQAYVNGVALHILMMIKREVCTKAI